MPQSYRLPVKTCPVCLRSFYPNTRNQLYDTSACQRVPAQHRYQDKKKQIASRVVDPRQTKLWVELHKPAATFNG